MKKSTLMIDFANTGVMSNDVEHKRVNKRDSNG